MQEPLSIAVIVGSLRAASFSRKVAQALIERAPKSLSCRLIEIGDLPLYNEDLDEQPPASWSRFRSEIRKSDGILFVTPEYNRSIPGCLKNAIDVGSRPAGKSVFGGMPVSVVSVTPYKLGAFGANHALRQTFVFLDMLVMQQPEAYIGGAGDLFDRRGKLASPETGTFLENFMAAFAHWMETVRAGSTPAAFEAFMKKRQKVAEDYVNGEPASLDEIVTQHNPATFFSPGGDYEKDAAKVASRYDTDAKSFSKPGSTTLEPLQSAASGELAFWTGFQSANARLGKKAEPVSMKLRVTEVFRFEDGDWKLVHRHADMAKEKGA
ncbi:MAG TPA: NAD(P)H-dependent oxidoreductase [Pseudolabrys sp.]|nr:NAD(P)H-dependent oxidoreductase [Pseudolabrys sp.]